MKTSSLKCPNCGATMKINEDDNTVVCPYCGETREIKENPLIWAAVFGMAILIVIVYIFG